MGRRRTVPGGAGTGAALLIILALTAGPAHAQPAQPSIEVDPSSGPPGSVVEVSGSGFSSSPCGVELRLDAGPVIGFASLDGGAFVQPVTIPAGTSPGEHDIVAQGLEFAGEFCGGPSADNAIARFFVEESSNAIDFTIHLKRRTIGPQCEVDADFVAAIQAASGRTHGIVQLFRLPAAGSDDGGGGDDIATLASLGIVLLEYLNGVDGLGTAYLASIAPDFAVGDPRFPELVRCLVPIEPGDKVANEIAGNGLPDPFAVLVRFFGDVSDEEAEDLFAEHGIDAEPFAPGLWQADLSPEQIRALADSDIVQWIEPRITEDLLDVDEVRAASGVDELQDVDVTTGVYGGLSGDGVQLGIMDSGVDDDHNDFAGRIVRFFSNAGNSDHGTHVAGIAAGSGAQSDQTDDNANPNGGTALEWRGIAPESEIAAYSSSGSSAGGNAGIMSDAINNFGVDASNHSYSSAPSGEYNALMAAIDGIIRGDVAGLPARPQLWSAGNGGLTAQYGMNLGYFGLTKNCKNCIIVANLQDDLLHNPGSSLGPTVDGRMKPDISTIGSNVRSVGADTDNNGNPAVGNGYRTKGGTSMATPAATGIVALMLEQYAATFGVNLDTAPPLPSTSRALLVHAADEIAGTDTQNNPDTGAPASYGNGPDWATGYGLANAPQTVRIIQDQGFVEDSLSPADDTDDWVVPVVAGQTRLRVTLSWDDRPGSPTTDDSAAKLVNDLDLTLIAPDGITTFRPLVMPLLTPVDCDGATAGIQVGTCAGLDSPAQNYFGPAAPGVDRRNNTEQVVVEDLAGLATGNWTARVSVLNDDGVTVRLPLGGTQTYSLVLEQPNRAPVAQCAAAEKNAGPDCCATVPVSDIDGGSFDPNGDADIATLCITAVDGGDVGCLASVEVCQTGNHTVTLTVTDQLGETSSCNATVTIADVTDPDITCPADAVLECPADTTPASTGFASATDNCTADPAIDFDDVSVPGCGGTETITRTWTATDDALNSADCVQTVETIDTTPPDVSCNAQTTTLWPPDHKLRDIGFTFTAEDACDPDPPLIELGATSDESPSQELGAGGPAHCPDAVFGADSSVKLRSERSGKGNGRVYAATVNATDACDNVASCSKKVRVPQSQKPGQTAVDSGQVYDAAVCGP